MEKLEIMELVEQGAEAKVYKTDYLGKSVIVKERFKKNYRIPELENHITKERIRAEAKGLLRSKIAGVSVPALYLMDLETRRLYMECIDGVTLKKLIDKQIKEKGIDDNDLLLELTHRIGDSIGKLHSENIIHGDLTSSNMLIQDSEALRVSFIDFGLSYVSTSAEDKAVDLYVLERALKSTHSDSDKLFENIISSYKKTYKSGQKEVLKKFEEVKARGRKRTMVG